MNDFQNIRRGDHVADTAYCTVYEAVQRWPNAPGRLRKCALKVARREDEATRSLMREEHNRLRRLVEIGDEDEPPLVPEPFALGSFEGQTSLLMEWVEGVPLDEQTSRGRANPKPPLYAVESLRRMVSLLEFVHRQDGLDAVLPDLKRDAIILAGRGVRVLDWNVLHAYADDGAARDFQRVVQQMTELLVGSRLGSFSAAAEAIAGLDSDLESALARAVFAYAHRLADNPAGRARLLASYKALAGLCGDFEEALTQLHWARLGIGDFRAVRNEIAVALQVALERASAGAPPTLNIPRRGLRPDAAESSIAKRDVDTLRRSMNRLVSLFVEGGVITAAQASIIPGDGAGSASTPRNQPSPGGSARDPRASSQPGRWTTGGPEPSPNDYQDYTDLRALWPTRTEKLVDHIEDLTRLYRVFSEAGKVEIARDLDMWLRSARDLQRRKRGNL